MSGYTKLFSDIVDSSLWKEDAPVCKVFITMLALCDRDGYIRGSVGWLADKARIPVKEIERAVEKFSKPDPTSRTPANGGRRIEVLEDGWLILNYLHFRDRLSDDAPAVSSRERVRKHRETYTMLRNTKSVTADIPASASADVSEKKKGGGGGNKLSDDAFLSSLKANPAFKSFDIERELSKMDAWLLAHPGRQKTRRFVVAWLTRIEVPLAKSVKSNEQKTVDGGW